MISKVHLDPLQYYATQSSISEPGQYAGLFADLPETITALCQVVQGLCIHYMQGELYQYTIPQGRLGEIDTRYMEAMLARIIALDERPLTEPRPPEKRLVGCCRDFALLLCAMLRHQRIPARTRVGFASYFTKWDPDFNCDHIITEYWDAREKRWRLVDPELDELAIQENSIQFDVRDVPRDQFLVGGKAWQMCRAGKADPHTFGVSGVGDMKGIPFVRGSLMQDLATQNKMELLNWDCWGLMRRDFSTHTDEQLQLLDRAARLTQAGDETFAEMRDLYEREADLKVPPVIMCYSPISKPREVVLPKI
jgi:hypothetical protein